MASKVQLIGGLFQDSEGNPLANGYLKFKLSQDGTVASVGSICSGIEITVQLDAAGSVDVATPQYIWANDQILPANTYYRVTGYTQQGQPAWGANTQQVVGDGGTFDVGTWIPNQVFSWTPPLSGTLLKTNGVPNAVQSALNIVEGANMVVTNVGADVTVDTYSPWETSFYIPGRPLASQYLYYFAYAPRTYQPGRGPTLVVAAVTAPTIDVVFTVQLSMDGGVTWADFIATGLSAGSHMETVSGAIGPAPVGSLSAVLIRLTCPIVQDATMADVSLTLSGIW